jgi:hypothetical protein
MFISLSRRSVPLIGRLAQMIDLLEQDEEDPGRLSGLFAMDHLVTRMRRNSENLLVLAGEEPVRRWSEPVPLTDVVRAATAEIEQYGRVQLNIQPGIMVSGHAAADILHLLAEIIENATVFSPRDTPVDVIAEELSGGVLLEVRDGGIGIPPARLSEINERIDNPPLVDVSVSRHMGLFAVSRLAARNGVRVQLQPAAPRGLSALVWLPDGLISQETRWQKEQRARQLAEERPSLRSRVAGQRTAAGGQKRPAAAAGRSQWFRVKRPSGRSTRGTGVTVAALGAAESMPAAAQGIVASGAPAPGLPLRAAAGPSPQGMPAPTVRDIPDETAWRASGGPVGPGPGQDSLPDADHVAAGLPVRTPGANMIHGSARSRTSGSPAPGQAPAPGQRAGSYETQPVTAPRETPLPQRSPELARARLSGFQLGSRDAETQAPSAGEEASR